MNRLPGVALALPPALAFAAAFALSAPSPAKDALAQDAPATAPAAAIPGQADPSRVTGGSYTADPHHTLVEWTVDHLGFTPYYGLFGDVTGTLDIDPKRPEQARVAVVIPVSKVTVASAGLKEHLLKPAAQAGGKADFFGAAPEDARFVSTLVRPTGDNAAEMTGNLTLNGVTKPVTLQVQFYGAGAMPPQMGGGEIVGFEATAALQRSDFDLGFAVPMVSDRVDLKIAAAFVKSQPGSGAK